MVNSLWKSPQYFKLIIMKKSNILLTIIIVLIFLSVPLIDIYPLLGGSTIVVLGMAGSYIIHR